MTPEEKLSQRITDLVHNTINRLPVPRAFTYGLDKYVEPFVKEIVSMSKEYVETKRGENGKSN